MNENDPRTVEDGSVLSSIGCPVCNGERYPWCLCETDCGSRRGEFYGRDCLRMESD